MTSLTTTPGAVVYVTLGEGNILPYVLGRSGVWYPIELGNYPYISGKTLSEMTWEEA